MNTPGFERIDFSKLVASVGGGMAVQGAVAEQWLKLTGHPLSQGWGLTETSPVVAVCRFARHRIHRRRRAARAINGGHRPATMPAMISA